MNPIDQFGIGKPIARVEDERLLTGGGLFVEDISLPNLCHGYVLRSPHAHADIVSIDISGAKTAPGVRLVLTAEDYIRDNLGKLPYITPHAPGWNLEKLHNPGRIALAKDRVRFVGDAVAFIVAETIHQAKDAAERIEIEYAPLLAVVATDEAASPDAPRLWDDCPKNIMFEHEKGNKDLTDAAFACAAHVIKERLVVSRVSPNAIENRSILSDYDAQADVTTVYVAAQSAFLMRRYLAEDIFKQPQDKFRVIINDVGGSFGLKGAFYPEYALTVWASRKLGRPVRWICERGDALRSDYHGRDNISLAELALDENGRFLAIRVDTIANLGAYPSTMPTGPATSHVGGVAGVYMFSSAHVKITGVYTNTAPVSSYRGAGRPEATFVIERLVDSAARELNMDRADLRRRNMIPPEALPYRTPFFFKFEGETFGHFEYDCGEFAAVLDKALVAGNYSGFEHRRLKAKRRGKLRGLGIAYLIEMAASPGMEFVELDVDANGTVTVFAGTANGGQGHHTLYAQVICEKLGVTPDAVRVVESDTGRVKAGSGTSSSRTSTMGGSAAVLAADKIIEKGKIIAAGLLECAPSDITFETGRFHRAGSNQSVSLGDAARAARDPARSGAESGLRESGTHRSLASNWPNGCHLCEVEIDPETGEVRLLEYTVAEDVGTVVNPMLLAGQVHGGVLQGLGQAVQEEVVYDRETGQLITGTFMDYAMPRADSATPIRIVHHPVPTKTNPLGVKGGGESGTIGSLACIMNGIVDALSPLGIHNIDMPATPEKVWRAIRAATVR